jgi:hydrogenase expression/formation protein HypC
MCRGIPGRVVAVDGWIGTVDFWGTSRPVLLQVIDEPVGPGDYVLCQRGYAIRRIPPEDVVAVLALYDDVFAHDIAEVEEAERQRASSGGAST